MLCKTSVARKVLVYAWKNDVGVADSEIHPIDSADSFGAAVDACLLVCSLIPGSNHGDCRVYRCLGETELTATIGYHDGHLVADVSAFERWKHLGGGDEIFRWRSGVKHDCSKVMELWKEGEGYRNGLDELVELEDDYLYPMLKSSEITSGRGKEPIRTLQELSKKHGFKLTELPIDSPGQEQKSQWLQIRRERPDYVLFWGWGVMNQVAVQEAANIRFPMENFVGIWWSGSENDMKPAGAGANGYKALAMHGNGMDYPVYADLKKYVYDAGKKAGAGDQVGTVVYSRGMYAAMVISEAVRKAQELAGHANVSAAEVRRGFEALEITEARMTELGLPHFGQPFKATCADHGGPGAAMIQQWDAGAGKWNLITGFIEPDKEVLDPLILADSEAYAKEAGLPTDRCK